MECSSLACGERIPTETKTVSAPREVRKCVVGKFGTRWLDEKADDKVCSSLASAILFLWLLYSMRQLSLGARPTVRLLTKQFMFCSVSTCYYLKHIRSCRQYFEIFQKHYWGTFLNIRFEKDGNNNAEILLSVKWRNDMSSFKRILFWKPDLWIAL